MRNNTENGREDSARYDYNDARSSDLSRHVHSFHPDQFRSAYQAMSPSGAGDNLPSMMLTDSTNGVGAGAGAGDGGSQSAVMQQFENMMQQFAQQEQQMLQQIEKLLGGNGLSGFNAQSGTDLGNGASNGGSSDNTGYSPTDAARVTGTSDYVNTANSGSPDATQPYSSNDSECSGQSTDNNSCGKQQKHQDDGDQKQKQHDNNTDDNEKKQTQPTVADKAKSLVTQVDNLVQIGNFTGALDTLHNSEKSVAASDPGNYPEFSSDLLQGLEHTATSDGTTGGQVMNALSVAYVNENWNTVSVPHGDHRYFNPVDIQTEIGAATDPIDQALLANDSGNFLKLYGLGTVQNADEANSLIGWQANYQGKWAQSFGS